MYRFPCLGRSEMNSHILTLRLYLTSPYKIHRSVSKPAAQMNWGITSLYVMKKTAPGGYDSAKICSGRTLSIIPTKANGAWLSWSLLMLLFKGQWNRNIFGVHNFKIWTPFFLLCLLCSPISLCSVWSWATWQLSVQGKTSPVSLEPLTGFPSLSFSVVATFRATLSQNRASNLQVFGVPL